jgi:hypothetical protein
MRFTAGDNTLKNVSIWITRDFPLAVYNTASVGAFTLSRDKIFFQPQSLNARRNR